MELECIFASNLDGDLIAVKLSDLDYLSKSI
jgi:hypothetical protein